MLFFIYIYADYYDVTLLPQKHKCSVCETPEHSIFLCQNNAGHKDIPIDTIELSFFVSQTPIPDRVINLKTILGYNSHLPTETQSDINAAVNSFFSCSSKSHI